MVLPDDIANKSTVALNFINKAENAFNQYTKILEEYKKQPKDHIFLIALGPTATVLSYDLSNLGFRAFDIGHIDICYEWFLRGSKEKITIPGKYTNEVSNGRKNIEECHDPKYLDSIIKKLKDK